MKCFLGFSSWVSNHFLLQSDENDTVQQILPFFFSKYETDDFDSVFNFQSSFQILSPKVLNSCMLNFEEKSFLTIFETFYFLVNATVFCNFY